MPQLPGTRRLRGVTLHDDAIISRNHEGDKRRATPGMRRKGESTLARPLQRVIPIPRSASAASWPIGATRHSVQREDAIASRFITQSLPSLYRHSGGVSSQKSARSSYSWKPDKWTYVCIPFSAISCRKVTKLRERLQRRAFKGRFTLVFAYDRVLVISYDERENILVRWRHL